MCISNTSTKALLKPSRPRWKVLTFNSSGTLIPLFWWGDYKAGWNKSTYRADEVTEQTGFHCYASFKEALGMYKAALSNGKHPVIAKLKVKGFLRSGLTDSIGAGYRHVEGKPCETWDYINITDVYIPDKKGKLVSHTYGSAIALLKKTA